MSECDRCMDDASNTVVCEICAAHVCDDCTDNCECGTVICLDCQNVECPDCGEDDYND